MMILKMKLLEELKKINGVEDRFNPMLGDVELIYGGKSFAHFHNNNELDLRLTKKIIKELGLSHPDGSVNHPNRSPNSSWIEVRFNTPDQIPNILNLVRRAVSVL